MLNPPDAVNLLTIARETLLQKVLPDLPPEKVYTVLMAANAMAIAAREASLRDDLAHDELTALEAFYGEAETADGTVEERLLKLNRSLARDARAGRFAGPADAGFRAILERLVRARLRVSNPKFLASLT